MNAVKPQPAWLARLQPWRKQAPRPVPAILPAPDAPPVPHPTDGPEQAIALRVAVVLNTIVAFAAYRQVDPDMPVPLVLPIMTVCIGMVFSYFRARHRNLLLKFFLAAGMLYALTDALSNLARGALDPRIALAQLLLWLQMLNSFDLPRRRNLRVAVLVASVLMVVTGTVSRSIDYGVFLIAFAATLVWANYEAFLAETGGRSSPGEGGFGATRPGVRGFKPFQTVGLVGALLGVIVLAGFPLFLAMPRRERNIATTTLPLSLPIPLPDNLNAGVRGTRRAGETAADALKNQKQGAFDSFAEKLDLNSRSVPSEELVMRVQSDRPQYWRAIAYDHYDGRLWSMSDPETVTPYLVATAPMRIPKPLGQSSISDSVTHTIYLERDQANLIYAAWAPSVLYFPTGLIWRDAYDALRSPVTLEKDMYYSVISEVPVLNRRILSRREGDRIPAAFNHFLVVPPAISARVKQRAITVVGQAKAPFAKMMALRDHLSESYPYDLQIPEAPPGAECVDHFMFEQKKGFCQQFASSLAITGRIVGVPTRLVTGFVPGDFNPFTGYWEVKGKHAHAWVEAYIPGAGWIPFDATPAAWWPETGGDANQVAASNAILVAIARYLGPPIRQNLPLVLLSLMVLLTAGLGALWYGHPNRRDPAVSKRYRRLRRRLSRLGVPANAHDTPRTWLANAQANPRLAPAIPALAAFVAAYEAARFNPKADADAAQLQALELGQRAEIVLRHLR